MDPRWVGAWWIPFLMSGAVMFVVMIPMLGYPKKLPGIYFIHAFISLSYIRLYNVKLYHDYLYLIIKKLKKRRSYL